jgi:F-type H+-transporting ATPase subunit c
MSMIRRFAVLAVIFVTFAVAAPVMAQEHGEAAGAGGSSPWGLFAPAIAIGFAAAFGALGQGRGLAASVEAIGRNPGAVGPIRITMIIGLALIESLVIYALIIAFLLLP